MSHIGGYGIPAIPTQPATAMFSHRFVGGYGIPAIPMHPVTVIFSHRFHGFTQMVGCVVGSHRTHRIHRSLLLRRNSHRFHGFTQMVRLRSGLPQNTQNSQKFIAEKKLPQISRIYTDVSKMFCVFREFCGRIFSASLFCVFREFCGSKYLCKSVKSVGEYSLPICSVNSVNSVGVLFWLRGYGRDAIPSYNSVGTTP